MTHQQSQFDIRGLIESCKGKECIILKDLGLNADRWGNVKCRCPIHNGDNPSGFSFSSKLSCWKCWTHHCEEDYGTSIFGLVKAIKNYSAREAKEYLENLLDITVGQVSTTDIKRQDYLRSKMEVVTAEEKIFPKEVLLKASKDVSYLLDRGFNQQTLDRYGAFYVDNIAKPMYERVCFPIYNDDGNIIGFTGRRTDDEKEPKWLHLPTNIRTGNYLFGIEQNKGEIQKTHTAILNESPLDVLRLSQAGNNLAVGTFGTNLSQRQIKKLLGNKVHNLILCYDPDKAGEKGTDKIIKEAQLYFRLFDLSNVLPNGLSKSPIEDIQTILLPEINKICSNQ